MEAASFKDLEFTLSDTFLHTNFWPKVFGTNNFYPKFGQLLFFDFWSKKYRSKDKFGQQNFWLKSFKSNNF